MKRYDIASIGTGPAGSSAAITSQTGKNRLPTHIEIGSQNSGLKADSVILTEQIRTIDKSRLKEKIFISGEVDKKDCETAVRIVNKYLKEPIEIPARCDFNRLYEIVKTIDIPEEEKTPAEADTSDGKGRSV